MEQITLYYRQGSSDKVYRASIESKGAGYVVNFAFGRRGTTLSTGTKTPTAVNLDAATAIYNKLVAEKQAKGYSPGEEGTPYQHTDKENQATGIRCQLLNAIGDDDLATLIASPDYCMQEKHDGRRLLIQKQGTTITGINRLGLEVALPKSLHDDAANGAIDFILDGEAVGDFLYAFDVLGAGEEDLRFRPYLERRLRLMNLLASFQHPRIIPVGTACTAEEKLRIFDELKAAGKEGVVFKKIDQPYAAGRPASGGPQLKFKFHETASFIVEKVNARRSVSLALLNGKTIVPAGNVTIPANRKVPDVGTIVEVRYLYAFKESGCIYQPVYLGARDDIPNEECTVDQLKYKTA
jgi:bifunctional non-homologous end joining protein LigD